MSRLLLLGLLGCSHEVALHTPESGILLHPAVLVLDHAPTCTTAELFVAGDDVLTGLWLEPDAGDPATLTWPAVDHAPVDLGLDLALRYCAGPEPLVGTLVLTFRSGEVRTVRVGP
jgi:hypothetical protein